MTTARTITSSSGPCPTCKGGGLVPATACACTGIGHTCAPAIRSTCRRHRAVSDPRDSPTTALEHPGQHRGGRACCGDGLLVLEVLSGCVADGCDQEVQVPVVQRAAACSSRAGAGSSVVFGPNCWRAWRWSFSMNPARILAVAAVRSGSLAHLTLLARLARRRATSGLSIPVSSVRDRPPCMTPLVNAMPARRGQPVRACLA